MRMSDLIDEWKKENKVQHFGLIRLNQLCKCLGYDSIFSSSVEHFLSDNPEAIQAIVEWIGDTDDNDHYENLLSCLPELDNNETRED